eukprot:1537367-Rhodomonas_salina.3
MGGTQIRTVRVEWASKTVASAAVAFVGTALARFTLVAGPSQAFRSDRTAFAHLLGETGA